MTYATSWLPDIKGIWSADADLEIIARAFHAHLALATLARYDTWVLIAHSMGGLVVQRALIDNPAIADKTRAIILFGTPSGGLRKANRSPSGSRNLITWPRAACSSRNCATTGRPRSRRTRHFPSAIAGEKDQFVPPGSSIDPFLKALTAVVAGNHLTMLDPSDLSIFDLIAQRITIKDNAADIGDSALRAIERGAFSGLIREQEPALLTSTIPRSFA